MVAEEVRASSAGGNGERLEVRVGTKSIGLQAQSLIPILLLLAFGLALYLVWVAMQQRLDLMQSVLVRILEQQVRQDQASQVEMGQIRRWLQIHEYNVSREPGDRLPLDVDASQLPPIKPSH